MRFVERGGYRIVYLVGQNNPWVSESGWERKDCLPCKGRYYLAQEAEKRTLAIVLGPIFNFSTFLIFQGH